ncbi:MAG: hypothetical protein JWM37_200 [Candidatus Saccharibacteria bacterium]|nr:hypothetical protein [Candidatus Saccharibacteria bacterium]
MASDNLEQLTQLRQQVLNELLSYSDQLATSEDVSYDTLLSIAHMTEDAHLLPKVLEKIHELTDEDTKANALLELLNEVELQMNPVVPIEESSEEAPEEEQSDEVFLPEPNQEHHSDQQ